MKPKNQPFANAEWRINTPALLNEIMSNDQCAILRLPLQLLGNLLGQVGERAAELNDPELNRLMCLLAIYSIADPYSPDYDEGRVQEVLAGAATAQAQVVSALKEGAERHGIELEVQSPAEFFEAHGFWPDGYNPDLVGARNVAKAVDKPKG